MSQKSQASSKIISIVSAVAITFALQGALIKGFDQMARESQTNAVASQAATRIAAAAAAVAVHTPG